MCVGMRTCGRVCVCCIVLASMKRPHNGLSDGLSGKTIVLWIRSCYISVLYEITISFLASFTVPTVIQTAPQDTTVVEGADVTLTCTATTDPEEEENLKVDWKRGEWFIPYELVARVTKNDVDHSLTIFAAFSLDSGTYTCVASNGVDTVEASARLIVQGKGKFFFIGIFFVGSMFRTSGFQVARSCIFSLDNPISVKSALSVYLWFSLPFLLFPGTSNTNIILNHVLMELCVVVVFCKLWFMVNVQEK